MKILINALAARRGGGLTYIVNLLKFAPVAPELHYVLLCGRYNEDLFRTAAAGRTDIEFLVPNFTVTASPLRRFFWEIFQLPHLIRKNKIDVYYAPSGIMLTLLGKNVRTATALRNMLPWDEQERTRFPVVSVLRWKLLLLRTLYLISYRLADRVVFISKYSHECVQKCYPGVTRKSCIIYHGLHELFWEPPKRNTAIEEKGLKAGEYYLYISILDYYKAQKQVIKEWEILCEQGFQYPLVLAGPCINAYGKDVVQLINNSLYRERIRYIGEINYAELPIFYQNARALVFASSCECCPNILLEKMSAGKPLFASSVQPMPEFAGDDAWLFDPYQEGDLAKVVQDAEKRPDAMVERGFKVRERAALLFDWKRTAEKTIEFITHMP
mgnify:CR=1 FL=1